MERRLTAGVYWSMLNARGLSRDGGHADLVGALVSNCMVINCQTVLLSNLRNLKKNT